MEKVKILFVCLGNICRSPSAESVMKSIVEKEGLSDCFEIDSAGILAYHKGEKADARMQQHASKRGYILTSLSRPVRPEIDFQYFDMIIGMDEQNIRDLNKLAPNEQSKRKIYKITDFAQSRTMSVVPDPYYGGYAGFELVLDILENACVGLMNIIFNSTQLEITKKKREE